jgi:hypothetical protein
MCKHFCQLGLARKCLICMAFSGISPTKLPRFLPTLRQARATKSKCFPKAEEAAASPAPRALQRKTHKRIMG